MVQGVEADNVVGLPAGDCGRVGYAGQVRRLARRAGGRQDGFGILDAVQPLIDVRLVRLGYGAFGVGLDVAPG
jgi:hypothetical protein